MTPQALMERRAWAREFEVEGFRFEGLDRGDGQGIIRRVSSRLSVLFKHPA